MAHVGGALHGEIQCAIAYWSIATPHSHQDFASSWSLSMTLLGLKPDRHQGLCQFHGQWAPGLDPSSEVRLSKIRRFLDRCIELWHVLETI